MPTLKIDGKEYEVKAGKKLTLAIEETGINIGHRCGGKGKCTTCKVKFLAGEPETMTKAEHERLIARELMGEYRLSCQILVEGDMELEVANTLESEGWDDTGPALENEVIPEAEWFSRADIP